MDPVRRYEDLQALPARARDARREALRTLARARREGLTIDQAIEAERRAGRHVSRASIERYASEALTRDSVGRLRPTRSDRLYRRFAFLTPEGVVEVDIRSSRQTSLAAEYRNAVKAFLEGQDPTGEGLRRFRGQGASGYPFETDLDAIERWARRQEIDELAQEGSS